MNANFGTHAEVLPKMSFNPANHITYTLWLSHQSCANALLTGPCLWASTIQVDPKRKGGNHLRRTSQRHSVLRRKLDYERYISCGGREVGVAGGRMASEFLGDEHWCVG